MAWSLSVFFCRCTCCQQRCPKTSAPGLLWAPAAGPAPHPHQLLVSLGTSQQLPKPLLELRAPGPAAVPIPQLGFSHGDGEQVQPASHPLLALLPLIGEVGELFGAFLWKGI